MDVCAVDLTEVFEGLALGHWTLLVSASMILPLLSRFVPTEVVGGIVCMRSGSGRRCFSLEMLILGGRRKHLALSSLVTLLLFILKEDLKQGLSFVQRMDVGLHRLGTAPPHNEAKAFHELLLKLLVPVSTLLDGCHGSAHSQVSHVVRRECNLLLLFETFLSWLEQLLPMMIETATLVGRAASSEEQRISIVKLFQSFATLEIVLGPFCSHIAM